MVIDIVVSSESKQVKESTKSSKLDLRARSKQKQIINGMKKKIKESRIVTEIELQSLKEKITIFYQSN